jgi:hypothetical protein
MGFLVMGRFESGTFQEQDVLYVHQTFSKRIDIQLWRINTQLEDRQIFNYSTENKYSTKERTFSCGG